MVFYNHKRDGDAVIIAALLFLMKAEVFVPINGYEGLYEVSNRGRVKSLAKEWFNKEGRLIGRKKDSIIKAGRRKKGYDFVVLCNGSGVKKYVSIHRIVAQHFVENPNGYNIVNHLDSNMRNNYFENLEWTTYSGNAIHAFANGRRRGAKGESHPMSKYTLEDVLRIRELYDGKKMRIFEIAKLYNARSESISKIVHRTRWAHI